MSLSIRAYPETIRSLAFGAFVGGYNALGTPFDHPIRLLKVVNRTDVDLDVSFDGVTDHDIITANSFYLYDVSSNRDATAEEWYFAKGTQIYVQGAPTTGSVYLVVYYGR